jgi:hypothetical protein
MATLQHPLARRLDELAIRAARAMVASALQGVEAEVVAAFDLHPGLAPLLADGRLNALSEALLALALRFVEDARVPVFAGSGAPQFLGELSRRNHSLFTAVSAPSEVAPQLPPRPIAPFIDRLGQHILGASWRPDANLPRPLAPSSPCAPHLAFIVTSERCADSAECLRLLRHASDQPIFWVFVSLSGSSASQPPGGPFGPSGAHAGDAPFGLSWGSATLSPRSDAGDLYAAALEAFAAWHERWHRASSPRLATEPPPLEEVARNRLTRTVADERTQAVRARAERERERVARTLEDVERGEAWPRARGPAAKGRAGDAAMRARPLSTQALVAPEWRIEPTRTASWAAEGDEVGVPSLSPSLTIEGERAAAAGPTESSADRLARIRARRLSRQAGR